MTLNDLSRSQHSVALIKLKVARDRATVTMADRQEVVYDLSNAATSKTLTDFSSTLFQVHAIIQ